MRKSILALFLALSLISCGEAEKKEVTNEKPVVKIGVVTSLSGNLAMIGEGLKNAILMAQEDINKLNLKNKYEFIIEDDAFEAKKTAMIFSKLKNVDKVDAVLSSFSQTGKVIAPQAEQAKIVHISMSSDMDASKGKYNFLHWTQPQSTSKRMLEFMKNKGVKKVVSIVANNAGSLPLEAKFMEQIRPEDGIEVSRYLIAPEEKDFKMLLAKTKEEKADAYLALIYGASFVPFFKQYHIVGETALITSIETFAIMPDFSMANDSYFTDGAVENDDFAKRYAEKYKDSSAYGSGYMYDMVMLTVKAFENAANKEQAVDELTKIKTYDGVVGKLTQDDNGIFNSKAVLKKIVNGKPIVVEE